VQAGGSVWPNRLAERATTALTNAATMLIPTRGSSPLVHRARRSAGHEDRSMRDLVNHVLLTGEGDNTRTVPVLTKNTRLIQRATRAIRGEPSNLPQLGEVRRALPIVRESLNVGEAIGAILTPAVGVALSPLPIVAVILMLFSAKARTNGLAFMAGWVIGLAVVVAVVLAAAGPAAMAGTEDDPSAASGLIHLLLGIALLALAYQQWYQRPKEGETPALPKWMQSIDNVSPVMALGLGAFLSGLNPKNLIFDISAGTSIAQADLPAGQAILAAAIFIILASVSVAGPVIWYLTAQEQALRTLDGVRGWLERNNTTVMMVLLGVLGVSQVGTGLSTLAG
jgi:threonine/homoserine/homoserine lactone efflux protein